MKTLRLILGDQLNSKHSWYKRVDDNVFYCMFEMRQETDYVRHHIQKVIGFFAAMREFSKQLVQNNHNVIYFNIADAKNQHDLEKNIKLLIEQNVIEHFEYQAPDEYRLDQQLKSICNDLSISSSSYDTEHFLTTRNELADFFEGKKQLLMERFYRNMRKKHHILMVGEQPEGGIWNYDHNNRKKWKGNPEIPNYKAFKNDVKQIYKDISSSEIDTIGHFESEYFEYPINLKQAQEQLSFFCRDLLPHFGDYQDALHTEEVYLFHSRLSFAMNTKIISPKEIIDAVMTHYRQHMDEIDIAQVEGFIRQVIGWREYMRGMYWKEMPSYKTLNELENHEDIPEFFWTGETKMNCLQKTIKNSLKHAYAHHIQRLMITGNYLLLTQTHPDAVDDWYLGIYIDAIQWVQLPNTRGMSQYADGGKIATKPYVSSGSYINKMSNYCKSCHYDSKVKIGDKACPFNSLYWNFFETHKDKLATNQRLGIVYNQLKRMDSEQKKQLVDQSQIYLKNIDFI